MTYEELIELVYQKSQTWEEVLETRLIRNAYRIFGVLPKSIGCFYGRTICHAHLWVTKAGEDLFQTGVSFQSIDDGDAPFIGPHECLQKAISRYELVKTTFEGIEYVPDLETAKLLSHRIGMFLNL